MRRPKHFGRFHTAGRFFVPALLLFSFCQVDLSARTIAPAANLPTAGFSKCNSQRRPNRAAASEHGVYELDGSSRIRVWPRDTIQGEAPSFDGNDGSGKVTAFSNAVSMKFVPGTNLLAVVDAKTCNGNLKSYPSIRFYEVNETLSGGILTGASFRLAGLFGDAADTLAFGMAFKETFYPAATNACLVYLDQATDIAFYGDAAETFVVTFRDKKLAEVESFLAKFRGYEHPELLSIIRLAKGVDMRIAPGTTMEYSAGPFTYDATTVAVDPDTYALYVGSVADAAVYRYDAKAALSAANAYDNRTILLQEYSYQYAPIVTTVGSVKAAVPDGVFKTLATEEGELGTFSSPTGISLFKPNGFASSLLLVADKGHNRIAAADAVGTLFFSFGEDGDGRGKFKNPSDVTLSPDGKLVVADTSNGRVQMFTLSESDIGYDESFTVTGIGTIYPESEADEYEARISVMAGATNRIYSIVTDPADVVTALVSSVEIPAGESIGSFRFKTLSGSASGSSGSITISAYGSLTFDLSVTNVPPTFYSDYAYFGMTNGACTALGTATVKNNIVYLGDTALLAASAFDVGADTGAFEAGNAYTWYKFVRGKVIPAPELAVKKLNPGLYEEQRIALANARLPNGFTNPDGWTSDLDYRTYDYWVTYTNYTVSVDPAMGFEVVTTNVVDDLIEGHGYQLWKLAETIVTNGAFQIPMTDTGLWRVAVAVKDADGATSCTLTERYWQFFQIEGRNPIDGVRILSLTPRSDEDKIDVTFALDVADTASASFTNAFSWNMIAASTISFDPCSTNELHDLVFEPVEEPTDEWNYVCSGTIDYETLYPTFFRLLFLYDL